MATAVMTSKGQITIPLSVRQQLGLDSGDRVEFVDLGNGQFAIMPATGDIRALRGVLKKPGGAVSVESMNRAIRDRAAGRQPGARPGRKPGGKAVK
jgi:antitoxin PrlF